MLVFALMGQRYRNMDIVDVRIVGSTYDIPVVIREESGSK